MTNAVNTSKFIYDLTILTDDELVSYMNKLIQLGESTNNEESRKQYEIEYCYAIRERQIRWSRQDAHVSYLNNQSTQQDNDDNYPEFDPSVNFDFIRLNEERVEIQQRNSRKNKI